mgnify:CR=1 FL=1
MSGPGPIEFRKVNAVKISDIIFEQLKEAIILKELLPEQQLPPENELARIFETSRMTVRQALARLKEQGFIVQKVGTKGGTFVQPVTLYSEARSPEEIRQKWPQLREVFEYRVLIEPEAAAYAAKRMTDVELTCLQDLIEKSEEPGISRELFRAYDVKFHLAIARGSGNSYIEQAVRKIRTEINPSLDLMPYDEETRQANLEIHRKLYEAIAARDSILAKDLMRKHVIGAAQKIYEKLFS